MDIKALCTGVVSVVLASPLLAQSSSTTAVEEVARRLVGTMDSSLQALEDVRYFDVTLRVCSVETDAFEGSGITLYLEQALSGQRESPYRVRVVHLSPKGSGVQLTNYGLRDESPYLGLCDREDAPAIRVDDISEDSCAITLQPEGNVFRGSTPGNGCPNSWGNAVRVTSEVTLGPDWMNSWDRGWQADGSLAWGAPHGPYEFRKVSLDRQHPMLVEFGTMIVGASDNLAQVAEDSSFRPVRYQICHIRLASEDVSSGNERLFYAEQLIDTPRGPYRRQSIYQITEEHEGIVLRSHKADSTAMLGLCERTRDEQLQVAREHITWNGACALRYAYDTEKKTFFGQTPEMGCASDFQGATSLTIEEAISRGRLIVWERWYDEKGRQVAGSESGPYVYQRTAGPQELVRSRKE